MGREELPNGTKDFAADFLLAGFNICHQALACRKDGDAIATKDWLQLVDKNHYVYRTLKKDDTRMVYPANFEYATGFENPDEVWEKKAIVGNKDDLPGCPTIGDKRALDWLRGELESKTFTQRIEDWVNSPQYEANVKMARISEARKFGVPDAKLTFARGDQRQNAYDYLEKYQIQSMIDRFSIMWPKFARLRIEG